MNKQELFYNSFLQLKTAQEAQDYLTDLLTPTELREFSDRLWIANCLNDGVKYSEIFDQTKASTRTIARVGKWLRNGRGGYNTVLSRLHHRQVDNAHL